MNTIIALFLVALATQPGDKFTNFAGFYLGKASLDDVQKIYGSSRIRESGDAGEYEAWICYSIPGGEVQFNSGEMGAGSDLLGFTITARKSANDCPKPTKPLPNKIGGIRLGASREQFASTVGQNVSWQGNVGTAAYEYKSETVSGTPLDVRVTLIATFEKHGLTKLVIWKIETT